MESNLNSIEILLLIHKLSCINLEQEIPNHCSQRFFVDPKIHIYYSYAIEKPQPAMNPSDSSLYNEEDDEWDDDDSTDFNFSDHPEPEGQKECE